MFKFLVPYKGGPPDDLRFGNGAIEHYSQEIGRLTFLIEENSSIKEVVEKELRVAMEILRNLI